MEAIFKGRTAIWTALAQFAAMLVAVAATIVVEPPARYDLDYSATFRPFLNLAVAILFVCLFVWLRVRRRPARARRLALVSALLFGVAAASLFAYLRMADEWSCPIDAQRIVVGQTPLPEFAIERPGATCQELILNLPGVPLEAIYDPAEMRDRHLALMGWYLLTVILFATSALFGIEALRVALPHLPGVDPPTKPNGT